MRKLGLSSLIIVASLLVPSTANAAISNQIGEVKVSSVSKPVKLRGKKALLIRSIRVYGTGVTQSRPKISCDRGCARVRGKKKKTSKLFKPTVRFSNVNWVVPRGKGITVKFIAKNKSTDAGRYARLMVTRSGRVKLRVVKQGCIGPSGKTIICPFDSPLGPIEPQLDPTGVSTWERNLLSNASFEGGLHPWAKYNGPSPSNVTMSHVFDSSARDGSGFTRLRTDGPRGSLVQDVSKQVFRGDIAILTMWARLSPGSSPGSAQLCIYPNVNASIGACSPETTLDSSWRKLSVAVNHSQDVSSIRSQLWIPGDAEIDVDTAILTISPLHSPNFEYDLRGWTSQGPGTTNFARYDNSSFAFDGQGYLEANTTIDTGSVLQDSEISVRPGDRIRLSAAVKANPGTAGARKVMMCLWSLSHNVKNCLERELTYDWQVLELVVNVTLAETRVRSELYMYGRNNFDFDAINLSDPMR